MRVILKIALSDGSESPDVIIGDEVFCVQVGVELTVCLIIFQSSQIQTQAHREEVGKSGSTVSLSQPQKEEGVKDAVSGNMGKPGEYSFSFGIIFVIEYVSVVGFAYYVVKSELPSELIHADR